MASRQAGAYILPAHWKSFGISIPISNQSKKNKTNIMSDENTALVKSEAPLALGQFSAFGNITHFENAQRMAKALSTSAMVPETYRGDSNMGSCLIALEMANRIGANVLSVMQNLYIVHGKPAWSSQFLIACVNASGRFSPLRYRMTGEKGTDTYGCIAWATDKTGEKLESPEITIGIARAEGWFAKNGSKWKTMPELMLRYRTATLFARLYAPEITLGMHTEDEAIDIVEVAPVVTSPVFAPPGEPSTPAKAKRKNAVVEAQVVAEPVRGPASPQMAKFNTPGLTAQPVNDDPFAPEPEPPKAPEPTKPADTSFEDVVDSDTKEISELKSAMQKHEVTEAQVVAFSVKRALMKPDIADGTPLTLAHIRTDKLVPLTKNILAAAETLKKIKEGI